MPDFSESDALETLRYSAPRAQLADFITLLFAWTLQRDGFDGWMPAVDGQIVIRVAGKARLETLGGEIVELPPFALIGPLSATMRLVASPGYRAIGAGFTPVGLRSFLHVPANAVTDQAIDLSGICAADDLLRLVDQTGDLSIPHHGWKAIEGFLLQRLDQNRRFDHDRIAGIDQWLKRSTNPSVEELSATLELSLRQTARLTSMTHGLSPKLLAMRWRTQRAAEDFALAEPNLRTLAHFGFSDQSHMIRDFRRFVGTTPKRFVHDEDIARHTFAGPRKVGARLI
ncbi:MAG: AraC family transcriptional regulator [Pseudomonadota bacterium]